MKIIIEYSDDLKQRIEDAVASEFHYKEKVEDPDWRPPTVAERRAPNGHELPREAPLIPNPISRSAYVAVAIKERFLKPALIRHDANMASQKAKEAAEEHLKSF